MKKKIYLRITCEGELFIHNQNVGLHQTQRHQNTFAKQIASIGNIQRGNVRRSEGGGTDGVLDFICVKTSFLHEATFIKN